MESICSNENDVDCEKEVVSIAASAPMSIFEEAYLVELSKSSWSPATDNNDPQAQSYLRGCKWAPDGTCCLAVVNNGGLHVLELPRELYEVDTACSSRPVDVLESVLKIPEGGLLYDFCWYPRMNSHMPETCCWLTTRQHSPIQLWDAYDGTLRCSYRAYNAVDELEPALSVIFSADGSQIHAGFKKCLNTFDVTRPGRDYVNQPINSSASCLSVSPTSNSLIAVGSWAKEISLYDIHEGNTKSIAKLRFHSGGVTHMTFLPDGQKLVSGARKDSDLLIWDIRFYRRPYRVLKRQVKTNQRIYFDVSQCGKFLISGGTDGVVTAWDLTKDVADDNEGCSYHKILYPLHNDCCNGVSIHPCKPILATSSGQHHITHNEMFSDSNELDNIENNVINQQDQMDCDTNSPNRQNGIVENSLVFWWTGKVKGIV